MSKRLPANGMPGQGGLEPCYLRVDLLHLSSAVNSPGGPGGNLAFEGTLALLLWLRVMMPAKMRSRTPTTRGAESMVRTQRA